MPNPTPRTNSFTLAQASTMWPKLIYSFFAQGITPSTVKLYDSSPNNTPNTLTGVAAESWTDPSEDPSATDPASKAGRRVLQYATSLSNRDQITVNKTAVAVSCWLYGLQSGNNYIWDDQQGHRLYVSVSAGICTVHTTTTTKLYVDGNGSASTFSADSAWHHLLWQPTGGFILDNALLGEHYTGVTFMDGYRADDCAWNELPSSTERAVLADVTNPHYTIGTGDAAVSLIVDGVAPPDTTQYITVSAIDSTASGTRRTGLVPAIVRATVLGTHTTIAPAIITITELGNGDYEIAYNPLNNGDGSIQLDLDGAHLGGASTALPWADDRFVKCDFIGSFKQTGNSYERLGAPTGASIADDIKNIAGGGTAAAPTVGEIADEVTGRLVPNALAPLGLSFIGSSQPDITGDWAMTGTANGRQAYTRAADFGTQYTYAWSGSRYEVAATIGGTAMFYSATLLGSLTPVIDANMGMVTVSQKIIDANAVRTAGNRVDDDPRFKLIATDGGIYGTSANVVPSLAMSIALNCNAIYDATSDKTIFAYLTSVEGVSQSFGITAGEYNKGLVTTTSLDVGIAVSDEHCGPSIALFPSKRIACFYGSHNIDDIFWRFSSNPLDTTAWQNQGRNTGNATFEHFSGGKPWNFPGAFSTSTGVLLIGCASGNPDTIWQRLVTETTPGSSYTWSNPVQLTTEGYFNPPVCCNIKTGTIHLFTTGTTQGVTNNGIFYLKSVDGGAHWQNYKGDDLTASLPIALDSRTRVATVTAGFQFGNAKMAFDSHDRPLILRNTWHGYFELWRQVGTSGVIANDWVSTTICPASNGYNECLLFADDATATNLRAYIPVPGTGMTGFSAQYSAGGGSTLETGRGGSLAEWTSSDGGLHWMMARIVKQSLTQSLAPVWGDSLDKQFEFLCNGDNDNNGAKHIYLFGSGRAGNISDAVLSQSMSALSTAAALNAVAIQVADIADHQNPPFAL